MVLKSLYMLSKTGHIDGVIVRKVNVKMSTSENMASKRSECGYDQAPRFGMNVSYVLTNDLFLESNVDDVNDSLLHTGNYVYRRWIHTLQRVDNLKCPVSAGDSASKLSTSQPQSSLPDPSLPLSCHLQRSSR